MKKRKIKELERLLLEVHKAQSQSPPRFPEGWRDHLMGELKRTRLEEKPQPSLLERLFPEPLLFRFAGVSVVCALAITLIFLLQGVGINQEFGRLLFDPLGATSLLIFML